MKKSFFTTVIALFACVFAAHAQSSLVATLNHEGDFSVFYGADALQKAHKAATHGDIITLSAGTFYAENISKAVVIRGAGMFVDTLNHTLPTILINDFKINVPTNLTNSLIMEGIYTDNKVSIDTLQNGQFLKCRLYEVGYLGYPDNKQSTAVAKDLTFIHCRIPKQINLPYKGTASFFNSVIESITQNYSPSSNSSMYFFTNCYVKTNTEQLYRSSFSNCVIFTTSSNTNVGGDNSTYYNNLLLANSTSSYLTAMNNTNVTVARSTATNLNVSYTDSHKYELTDEQKALVKGADGTEVGIHGGNLPYDPIPSNPQITKFNVAKKSTADGKLNVVIEINGTK